MHFTDFTDLVSQINKDLGIDFCNEFQYTRKELTDAGRVAEKGRLFGNVYDFIEEEEVGFAYSINLGSTNEIQYHIYFDEAKIEYGLGFNTQYVPFRQNVLADVLPFIEAFLELKPELQALLPHYDLLGDKVEKQAQLDNPQDGQYTLWGKEIALTEDKTYYYLLEDEYQQLLTDLKGKQFEAYIKIFEKRNEAEGISFLHEKIYVFLQAQREKNPSLYFLPRYTDVYGRLSRGYWFWGNHFYLTLTFWKGTDRKTGSRIIGLYVDKDGTCVLRFSATDDERKAKILKTIAAILPNIKQQKSAGKEIDIWEKRYKKEDYEAYIQTLTEGEQPIEIYEFFIQYFIEKEKPTIDAILGLASAEVLAEFSPLQMQEFEPYIAQIESYRKGEKKAKMLEVKTEEIDSTVLLTQLSLKNIGIFSQLSLNLSKRVTVLIGENGIGKTTILRAIALALTGINENTFVKEKYSKIGQLLHVENKSNNSSKGNIQLSYQYEGKACQNTILFSSDEAGINVEDDPNSDFAYLHNDTFPHLILGFPQLQNSKGKQQNDFDAKLKKPHIKDILPLIANEADDRLQVFSEWISTLFKIGSQAQQEKNATSIFAEELIHYVFALISEVIGTELVFLDVTYTTDNSEIIWVKDVENDQEIPLSLISQGFNNVLGWIGHFLKRLVENHEEAYTTDLENSSIAQLPASQMLEKYLSAPAIVLIDEIDTYLHPKWQVQILKVLVEKFPKTQFIVTTHSPLVLSTLDNRQAAAYRIEKEAAYPIPYFYGTRIQDLLDREYGIRERPSEVMTEKIDALLDAIYEEDMPLLKRLHLELKEVLGEDDPVVLEAKLTIEKAEEI